MAWLRQGPYTDPFLVAVSAALASRHKALGNLGRVHIEDNSDADMESLRLVLDAASGRSLTIEFFAGNWVNVLAWRHRAPSKGRIDLRLDGLRLIKRGDAILQAVEHAFALVAMGDVADVQWIPESEFRVPWQALVLE